MNKKLAKTQTTLLTVSGALLIFIGTSTIVSPADFFGANNINAGASLSLLNELKAPAGLLLVAGIFMITAGFMRNKSEVALWLAALIYLSYAGSRSVNMAFDGVPAAGLVFATVIEAIIGLTCLMVWLMTRTPADKAV